MVTSLTDIRSPRAIENPLFQSRHLCTSAPIKRAPTARVQIQGSRLLIDATAHVQAYAVKNVSRYLRCLAYTSLLLVAGDYPANRIGRLTYTTRW